MPQAETPQDRPLLTIAVHARKSPRFSEHLDIADLGRLILLVMAAATLILLGGFPFPVALALPVGYALWVAAFKFNRPPGYWRHWLRYQTRPKLWTPVPRALTTPPTCFPRRAAAFAARAQRPTFARRKRLELTPEQEAFFYHTGGPLR